MLPLLHPDTRRLVTTLTRGWNRGHGGRHSRHRDFNTYPFHESVTRYLASRASHGYYHPIYTRRNFRRWKGRRTRVRSPSTSGSNGFATNMKSFTWERSWSGSGPRNPCRWKRHGVDARSCESPRIGKCYRWWSGW